MPDFNVLTLPLRGMQLIEASAGTGKTHAITNLCLRLLLGRDRAPLSISEILILTFTIAATDELKYRISNRINEARQAYRTGEGDNFLIQLVSSSDDPIRELKLLTAAIQLMDEASIFTIHGFCARVLGEQAFESGELFNQELNAERSQMVKLASEDCFRMDILDADEGTRELGLSLWASPFDLALALTPFLFRGELDLQPPYQEFDIALLADKARQVKARWIDEEVEELLAQSGLAKGRLPIKRLSEMAEFCRTPGISLDAKLWEIYSSTTIESATKKNGTIPTHPVLDLINEVFLGLPIAKVNLWHDMLRRVNQRIRQYKDEWHKFTLDDLLTRLAGAVNRPGSSLAVMIANRWPVAMIDEFQDTDSIQHAIFSTVYRASDEAQTLLLIGDPKQAIYNFRGADVYTYINARRQSTDIHTLGINWRSSPSFIAATNYLFDQPNIFGNDTDIPFLPVNAAPSNEQMQMTIDDAVCSPYQLIAAGDQETFCTVADLRERLMSYAAEETVGLINGSGRAMVNGEPVNAGQIAFLVRKRDDARAAQAALAVRGIQSVYLTSDSVFLQDTASDLRLILQAVLEPANDHAIRAALASRLMQTGSEEINALNHDVMLQQQVLTEFRNYHELWQNKDIAPMLNKLIDHRALATKWLNAADGERQLTNLRHLIELLQQRSSASPGMYQLIKWFSLQQREEQSVAVEEQQLRLESDENLVKIVTMHAAKGLQYDIVMIPMPVFSDFRNSGPALFHREQQGKFITSLELGDDADHRQTSIAEQKSEDMRLLYVSMTRAKYRCYLGLPKLRNFAGSAYGRLLRIDKLKKTDDLENAVRQQLPAELFDIVDGNRSALTQYSDSFPAKKLVAPPTPRRLQDSWRIHSYTSVAARLAASVPAFLVTGYGDDDASQEQLQLSNKPSRFTFPRGPRVGVVLHSLMEDLDFIEPARHSELCSRAVKRLGLTEPWLPVLEGWLKDILASRLDTFSLQDLARNNRLDEMEFHFPLAADQELIPFLHRQGYLADIDASGVTLEGIMTGLIDLLFRHDGKYYVADYKSNYLGPRLENYAGDSLSNAMDTHQYHLQYLIYTVAVHRMLQLKMPDYDYDEHFGGVFYLFLRGMNEKDGHGIFFEKPERSLIQTMDELLGRRRG